MTLRVSHKLDLRRSLGVATWNVLTMSQTVYQVALVRELGRHVDDIACLTESWLTGSGKNMVEDCVVLHSGGSKHSREVSMVLTARVNWSLRY